MERQSNMVGQPPGPRLWTSCGRVGPRRDAAASPPTRCERLPDEPRSLRIVLVAGLGEAQRCAALTEISGPSAAGGLSPAGTIARLVELGLDDSPASANLAHLLHRALAPWAPVGAPSMMDLATLWWQKGPHLRGRDLAGLLWSVATRPGIDFRKLERRMVEDIEHRALESLASCAL
jgi:hypothetical protein